ncbi:PRC-barrel domain-containing protein [Citreimonas salinaria]|uniref:PRC-barrel domain-containing protein n=1 Tax=Citreimonas salinaria TaxID=321339 RepID=A0A1H3J4D4_9RHOB|nr:PRC-barrel domain-containing protein [Citreimonas salinaria]SDY34811.1 PRC-barrel domain-containing protein [Citreimonas salinaria]
MKRLIGTTAIATLMALPLAAQQDSDNQSATGSQAPAEAGSLVTTGDANTDATAQGGVTDGTAAQADTQAAQPAERQQQDTAQMRIEVTSLIDQAVYLPSDEARQNVRRVMDEAPDNWEMVGEIRDLIVARDGTVAGVMIDAGGYLGGDNAQRIVPMNAMTFVRDGNDEGEYFVLFRGNEQAFGQAPAYDSAAVRQAGGASAAEAGFLDDVQREGQPVEMVDVNVDNVLGARAYGPQGEWVGAVSELAVAEDGQIEAFIVDVGGFLGVGDKPVALEPDQVDVTRTGDDALRVSVDATEAELESMERWAGAES